MSSGTNGGTSRKVWLYWESRGGKTEPPHVAFCRQTAERRSGVPVEIVTPESLRDYLPGLSSNIDRIVHEDRPQRPCIGIKSAFVRAFILERYGGLFLDSDALVLQDLHQVFDAIEKHGFVCTEHNTPRGRFIPNSFLGSVAGGELIRMYAEHLRYELQRRSKFNREEVTLGALTPLVNGNPQASYVYPDEQIPSLEPAASATAEASGAEDTDGSVRADTAAPSTRLSGEALLCTLPDPARYDYAVAELFGSVLGQEELERLQTAAEKSREAGRAAAGKKGVKKSGAGARGKRRGLLERLLG